MNRKKSLSIVIAVYQVIRKASAIMIYIIIFFTQKGEMYVATFGGGLNKLLSLNKEQATFKAYTMKNGLPSDVLLSIEEDKDGNLWCATERRTL